VTPGRSLFIAILAVLLAREAYADSIEITLTDPTQSGGMVRFDATLTNLTGSTIFLNGASATTSSSFLTVDTNPFLTNAPLSLAGNASSGPFAAFNVFIAPGTPAGSYSLNSFSILGGLTSNNFNSIGSADFTVNVSPGLSVAPEPGTLVLVGLGVLGIGLQGLFWRRTRAVSK
jgi:PEP-CTERM motif